MRIKGAELEPKIESTTQAHIPSVIDADYEAVHDAVVRSQKQDSSSRGSLPHSVPEVIVHEDGISEPKGRKRGKWVVISNIETSNKGQGDISIEEEVAECFSTLEG